MPARTYQDLLKNPYDEQLFDYYFTAQLVRIKEGAVYEIGKPAIYGSTLSLSPDKSLLLIATVHRPYSYQVPIYNFPQKFEVIDLQGNSIYTLADNPTINIPMGYDTTSPYPRQFGWRSDQPATVYWAEAQDKGDPKQNKTDFMDIIYQISYPFNSEKQEVAKTEKRFRNILWNDDAFALLIETSRETRKTGHLLLNLALLSLRFYYSMYPPTIITTIREIHLRLKMRMVNISFIPIKPTMSY